MKSSTENALVLLIEVLCRCTGEEETRNRRRKTKPKPKPKPKFDSISRNGFPIQRGKISNRNRKPKRNCWVFLSDFNSIIQLNRCYGQTK